MKKTLLLFFVITGCLFIGLPATKAENKLFLPSDTIGISEATYNKLQTLECAGYEDSDLGTQYTCPDLVANLLNKVVFRAEHSGEMYKVSYLPDPSGNFATVILKTYLPDGFYKASNKYYWVSNNIKLRLKKGSAYSTLLSGVKCDDAYCMAYTGVSKEDFEDMLSKCEIPTECTWDYIHGEDLRWQLHGKVIMQAYDNGNLYYISNNDSNTLYKLGHRINKESFYKFLKNEAIAVNNNLIKQISNF